MLENIDPGFSGRAFDVAAVTDCGLVRSENQDSIFADAERCVFCVADGVGGGDCGAKASEIACSEISAAASSARGFVGLLFALDAAAKSAHDKIAGYAERNGLDRVMGTTIALLAVNAPAGARNESLTAAVAHVGDSRVYRCRGGRLKRLTRDHTVAEEISPRGGPEDAAVDRSGRLGHTLTRAVGPGEWVGPDWLKIDAIPGDVFLVCTDGVHDMVRESLIEEILSSGCSAGEIAERLALCVRNSGAADNYSMIVVRYTANA